MTKEMTTDEVKAYAATVNHQNLLNKFNYLTKDIDNWKMPFGAAIPSEHFDEYNEAAIYFAGSPLEIVRIFKKNGKQFYDVFGEGYYNCIGA